MKIFYIGQLDQGTTTLDRMNSLKHLGHEVVGFDISEYQSKFRLLRSMQWRFQPSFLLDRLNKDIQDTAISSGTFNCAWIDKGVWIFPETIHFLKKNLGLIIHFTPDPQFAHATSDSQLFYQRSKHFIKSIPIYDFVVTTKSFEVDLYSEHNAKEIILSQQSYCPHRYLLPKSDLKFKADVGFVGHCERHYAQQINAFDDSLDVKVWGNGWPSSTIKFKTKKKFVAGQGVWRDDYVNALASFQIGLGFLSKYIPEQHTTRSFEIPAAGTFLLAERTPEHQIFFEEGREAEFFESPEEMVSKTKFYLKNNRSRQLIADNGKIRATTSGYDTDSVISQILKKIGASRA